MNRNAVTTIDKLVEGDRFYKFGDKKKTPMAVVEITSTRASTVDSIEVCASDDYKPDVFIVKKKTIKNPKEFTVVFLRHEVDIA